SQVFPAGANNAAQHFMAVLKALMAHPNMGEPVRNGVRRLPIPRTPFSIIYRIRADRIEVLRVRDQRSRPEV
ncbi:MAG: type II toxin-antitoxin system RelE/ParE family toxin, partial [Beijerinckiaceae bacterium]